MCMVHGQWVAVLVPQAGHTLPWKPRDHAPFGVPRGARKRGRPRGRGREKGGVPRALGRKKGRARRPAADL